jgi:hypothetical protein
MDGHSEEFIQALEKLSKKRSHALGSLMINVSLVPNASLGSVVPPV